ncbi:MAG TPA: protein-tyrosine phosphatase family protein, partial [Geminicoccaceae bacterium]
LDGHILPADEHVGGLIDFVRAWQHDEAPLLIHCVAGISRSMAAALITLVIKAPGREVEAARHVRGAAPHAYPNRRMIAVADQLLGCEGRLVQAREAMGPANLLPFGPLVALPLLP